ncbi:amidohydrolase family protein [Chryseolinea sp. H1M3-3]|uniref:amidohydrolase family protein n=1 Tax=Chryseolinea sp. H1M3-3 TaxID=3034144 RepID=UPI0023EDBA6F|nr:amidohydrolase family protein [Chryseolinea sp. H1M3-3]
MKIFDFNVHLPQKIAIDVNEVIDDDLNLTGQGLIKGLNLHYDGIKEVSGVNILLFNQKLFYGDSELSLFVKNVKQKFDSFLLTALIDFRDPLVDGYLEETKLHGVSTYMFNSYLQQIEERDFPKILEICKYAEQNKKIICIDGSYGTSKMYTYDNMKLACYVADNITKVPIVIIHSGGYRIMEAMLLAMDKKNVMLDSSFSLNYYLGSSLEQDYTFAYKRLGSQRILFGSDIPYVNFRNAFEQQLDFFNRSKFSLEDIDNIFYKNAQKLVNGDW